MRESDVQTEGIPLVTTLGTLYLTIEHFAQQVRAWAGRDGAPPITIDDRPHQVLALIRRAREGWDLRLSDTDAHPVGEDTATDLPVYEALRAALLPAVTAWIDANPEVLWVAVDREFAADLARLRETLERETRAYHARCASILNEISAISALRYAHHANRPASLG